MNKLKLIFKWIFGKRDIFIFLNEKYNYFWNPYNWTMLNERCIEIPIIKKFVFENGLDEEFFEIGNVLRHYFDFDNNVVIDKYEKPEGILLEDYIINDDILDYRTSKRFKLIVSISTLEHIGMDEKKDPRKSVKAINHIKKFLDKDGIFVATIPVGYNKILDKNLSKLFTEVYTMKRIENNKWEQCKSQEIKNIEYDYANNRANGLYICIYKKDLGNLSSK